MLCRAKDESFAFPAINCFGFDSVSAAPKGFADAGSDGISQFITGGAEFAYWRSSAHVAAEIGGIWTQICDPTPTLRSDLGVRNNVSFGDSH